MWLEGRRGAQEWERETPIHQTLSEQERDAICIYSRILSFQDKLIKSRDDRRDDGGNTLRAGSERETFANTT